MPVVSQVLKSVGQRGAVENARSASTALARRRVEREEVELFMSQYSERRKSSLGA